MNRTTKIIIGSILFIMLCGIVVSVWGVYTIWNNPSVRKGIESAKSEFAAMMELREKILSTYPCQDVGVQIRNGTGLNITLVNSEYNDLSYSEQSEKAREIAVFVKNNYTGEANIQGIFITFTESAQSGPINTNLSSSFSFNVSELE
jgi:hypothetical protein